MVPQKPITQPSSVPAKHPRSAAASNAAVPNPAGGHPHSQVTIPVGQSDAATGFAQAVKKGLMAGSAGTGGAPFVSLAPLE